MGGAESSRQRKDVLATLRNLQDDPNYKLDKKEDSYLYCAYQGYTLPVILSEQVLHPQGSTHQLDIDEQEPPEEESRAVVVNPIDASSLETSTHSFVEIKRLLHEANE